VNSEQEENERHQNLNRWLVFKRKTSQIAITCGIDVTQVATVIDQEIETASKRKAILDELTETDFAAIKHACDLPAALIHARLSLHWSQPMIGEQVGLKRQEISRYESSNYSNIGLAKAILIAQAFHAALIERKQWGMNRGQ
jgi:hypothetical protein